MPTGDGVWFNVRANDYISLWLNGVRVNGGSGPWTGGGNDWVRVAPSYFVSGENLLAVLATNQAGTSEGDAGACWELQVDATAPANPPCHLGTRVKTSISESAFWITSEALVAAVGSVRPYLAPILQVVLPRFQEVESFCETLPPELPTIDWLDLVTSGQLPQAPALVMDWVYTAYKRANWNLWCECIPGTGVVNYTTPDPPEQPADLPDLPDNYPTGCDLDDLCAKITDLQRALGPIRDMVTLIQRQEVPFAYLLGATHTVSGNGSFSVQGIIGLSVNITIAPDWLGGYPGMPATKINYGWINVGTVDGWERSIPLRHDPQLILGISGAVTVVGYTLELGVTCVVQELVREP